MESTNRYERYLKIMDDDEEIIMKLYPNKKRFIAIRIILYVFLHLLFGAPLFVFGFLIVTSTIKVLDENGNQEVTGGIFMMIVGGIILLMLLYTLVAIFMSYKKTVYLVTNKRLVIQGGYVGIDFKSLPISDISVINVNVDFADKLIKPNTGTMIFASASNPLYTSTSPNAKLSGFMFAHINDPYENYKKIKELIDDLQKKEKEA